MALSTNCWYPHGVMGYSPCRAMPRTSLRTSIWPQLHLLSAETDPVDGSTVDCWLLLVVIIVGDSWRLFLVTIVVLILLMGSVGYSCWFF